MIETTQKILDTAEHLFATQGYAGTSLRHIIAEAGVNVAAIHYHFGGKEDLLDAVILRKAGPVNDRRLSILDGLEAGGKTPTVEEVLGAFFQPMAETAAKEPQFVAMMGRVISEGLLPAIAQKHFAPVTARIWAALMRAVPELPQDEFRMRVQFLVGAMAQTVCGPADWPAMGCAGIETRIEYLVTFLSAGFRARATRAAARQEKK